MGCVNQKTSPTKQSYPQTTSPIESKTKQNLHYYPQ